MDFLFDIIDTISYAKLDTLQIIIYLIMFICIWILLREIKCWYWKVNDILREQQRQTEALYQIINELQIARQKEESKDKESAH